jgi:hypothetical protein
MIVISLVLFVALALTARSADAKEKQWQLVRDMYKASADHRLGRWMQKEANALSNDLYLLQQTADSVHNREFKDYWYKDDAPKKSGKWLADESICESFGRKLSLHDRSLCAFTMADRALDEFGNFTQQLFFFVVDAVGISSEREREAQARFNLGLWSGVKAVVSMFTIYPWVIFMTGSAVFLKLVVDAFALVVGHSDHGLCALTDTAFMLARASASFWYTLYAITLQPVFIIFAWSVETLARAVIFGCSVMASFLVIYSIAAIVFTGVAAALDIYNGVRVVRAEVRYARGEPDDEKKPKAKEPTTTAAAAAEESSKVSPPPPPAEVRPMPKVRREVSPEVIEKAFKMQQVLVTEHMTMADRVGLFHAALDAAEAEEKSKQT